MSDTPDPADELDFLFNRAAAHIVRDEDPAGFMEWFRLYAPKIAPEFFKSLPSDAAFRRGFLTQLSRIIWNKTPLPGHHYRPHPLPKPERNQPCLCGSGKKYKQCCQAVEGLEQGLPEFSMLLHVLDVLPAKQRAALPYAYLNLDELAHVANTWLGYGNARDAAKLLEGLFADWDKLDQRAEPALYCLFDCYDRLGNPLKKKRLLERAMAAPDTALRASAMQRQCTIHADRGEYDLAWPLFQQAQRLAPNDPSLSHLEVIMLMSQGERARAKERAAFWIARLAKDKTADHTQLIAFLDQAVNDMSGSVLNALRQEHPALERFAGLASRLPPPACHYALELDEASAGPLHPDARLARLHREWERCAGNLGAFQPAINWRDRLDWLDWIEKNPLAWHSFEVLDDLVQALKDTEPRIAGMEEKIVLPLLRHAEAVLRLILKQHRAEGLKLEWGWMENRPALRLMAELAWFHAAHDRLDQAIELMAWLVDTLNPNDNQGLRDDLIHHYLRANRIEAALDLAARYPDDLAAMQYGHILALYLAGRIDEAATLLKQTHARYPEVGKMLLAANPRRPALRDGLVSIGGKDEAWFYREDNLDVWAQGGGLGWLRGALTKQPGKGA